MSAKRVTESYNKKMSTLTGGEESGVQRLVRERTSAAIERVSKKTKESVVKTLAELKVQLTAVLDNISSQLATGLADLKDVQDAIKAEQEQLKNLYDISAEANSLQALQLSIDEEKAQWAEQKTEREKARQREEEQYNYDLRKRRQEEDDRVQAQRLERQRSFEADLAAKTEALTMREEAIAAREAEIRDLQARVASFDETLKKETSREVAIVTNSMKRDHEHATRVMQLEHKNLVDQKTAEVTALTKQVAELQTQYRSLDAEYKAATAKVQAIAEKAIDGASRQQTVVQMASSEADRRGK
jgi:chromosome segregation ATPase